MRLDDESLEGYYPKCSRCGEDITGDGYKIDDEYYCEDCVKSIDGTDVAEENRYAAYERANED